MFLVNWTNGSWIFTEVQCFKILVNSSGSFSAWKDRHSRIIYRKDSSYSFDSNKDGVGFCSACKFVSIHQYNCAHYVPSLFFVYALLFWSRLWSPYFIRWLHGIPNQTYISNLFRNEVSIFLWHTQLFTGIRPIYITLNFWYGSDKTAWTMWTIVNIIVMQQCCSAMITINRISFSAINVAEQLVNKVGRSCFISGSTNG